MSRSKRKNPISSITTSGSEKEDKQRYNRRYRHKCKNVLRDFDAEQDLIPLLDEVVDVWNMSKDGKMWFDEKEFPEEMRK